MAEYKNDPAWASAAEYHMKPRANAGQKGDAVKENSLNISKSA
jgi:hypothetical protein